MDLTGHTVLIVEDELLVALDLADALTQAGARIIGIACKSEEALEVLRAHKVSLAVLDVTLGDHSSQLVAERLNTDGIPYIFYTGNVVSDHPPEWMQAPVVAKPGRREDLLGALSAAHHVSVA